LICSLLILLIQPRSTNVRGSWGHSRQRRHGAIISDHRPRRVFQALQSQPAVVSFAQASYRPFHTYYFVNAAGMGRWARYHWEPEAGVAGQPVEELAKQPHDYLYEEFERRLLAGPVAFRLKLELAQDGDPVDDPSAIWPDGRERVVVGRLELIRPITEREIGDPVMMQDPTAVTDGIEISPDDQIIAARRGPGRSNRRSRSTAMTVHDGPEYATARSASASMFPPPRYLTVGCDTVKALMIHALSRSRESQRVSVSVPKTH
jgi:hypothetical protein